MAKVNKHELYKYLNNIAQLLVELDRARKALDEIQERLVAANAEYQKIFKHSDESGDK